MSETDDADYLGTLLFNCGIRCDTAEVIDEALLYGDTRYDIIFAGAKLLAGLSESDSEMLISAFGKNVFTVISPTRIPDDVYDTLHKRGFTDFFKNPAMPIKLLKTAVNKQNMTETSEITTGFSFGDLTGKHILLAEDLDINREIVTGLLEDTHAEIDIAENGEIAVRKFAENPELYDIILMDIQMPIMDGISAVKAIRASGKPRCETIPIYAMTANAFREDAQNCIEAGMNGHISKPIDIVALHAILEKHLK
jgi:CheY-like chemotaxis protein